MNLPESDALWLRHLSGETLRPWEEERLLAFLEEDPGLRGRILADREMDGLLRDLERCRRSGADFARRVARARSTGRTRERPRSGRKNTTRRLPRAVAPRETSGSRPWIIAAEFLIGVAILIGLVVSSSDDPAPATARRPVPASPPVEDAPRILRAAPEPVAPPAPEPRRVTVVFQTPTFAEPAPPPAERTGARATAVALAVLDRAEGDVYVHARGGLRPAAPGHDLLPGDGISTVGPRSRAVLKFPDSTRVEIAGDTILRELSEGPGKRLTLAQGALGIQAARQPAEAPMELLTAAARITVVGTRFTVACDPDATRVSVEEGRVKLGGVEVGAGECAGAAAGRVWSGRRLKTYVLPGDDFRGTWRFDQVWPDDPLQVANYTPLVWSGRHWRASDQGSGGQPSAELSDSSVGLGVRMWWPDQLGSKLASLAFIAPADGTYMVEGAARTEILEGGTARPIQLQVLALDRTSTSVSTVATIPLTGSRLLDLQELVPLQARQELVFLPRFPEKGRVACTVRLEGLRISRVALKN